MARLLVCLISLSLLFGCAQRFQVIKAREQPRPAETASDQAEVDALVNEGLMLYRQDDQAGARRLLDSALTLDYSHWLAHYYKGLSFLKGNQYAAARQSLITSLEFVPGENQPRSLIYLALAECWEEEGNLGQAELNYTTALNLDPESSGASAGLARIERKRRGRSD